MTDSPLILEAIFDAKARLQLLHVEARRQMAERLAKKADTAAAACEDLDEDDGDETDAIETTAAPTAIPDR